MKTKYWFWWVVGTLITGGGLMTCSLKELPTPPQGINNQILPVFGTSLPPEDQGSKLLMRCQLQNLGNVKIMQHGWVWSPDSVPSFKNQVVRLGQLSQTSFDAVVSGLELNKKYYLRPYLIVGSDTIYGPEQCTILGLADFDINIDLEVFKGAIIQFLNHAVDTFSSRWEFGDGTTSSKYSPSHVFNKVGTFMVRLIVSKREYIASTTIKIKVLEDPFDSYWVLIPTGRFFMGCNSDSINQCKKNELPPHMVAVDSFYIGKTEITQKQWMAVMKDNPSFYDSCGLDCPVESVSWVKIMNEFIPTLYRKTGKTYRLPTEAEWEYAAQGGWKTKGFQYAGSDDLYEVAWFRFNGGGRTNPVAQKKPNEYGLYDMSGNVWEYCSDWYNPEYYSISPIFNPLGPTIGKTRIMRGGDFLSYPDDCRLKRRYEWGWNDFDGYDPNKGFRLVRSFK